MLRCFQQEIEELRKQLAEFGSGSEGEEGANDGDEGIGGDHHRRKRGLSEHTMHQLESEIAEGKRRMEQEKGMAVEEKEKLRLELQNKEQQLEQARYV